MQSLRPVRGHSTRTGLDRFFARSILLGHPKLVGTAGMSPASALPYAQNKDGKAAEGGKCCGVGSTNAAKL